MKNTRWGLALGAIALLATSNASAAPSQNDDTGRYFDDLSDADGIASGSDNAELSGSGWIALEDTAEPGTFTTKVISPSALSAWGKVYVKGSGTLSIRVLSGANGVLATPTMVASDDAGFSRMADISSVLAGNNPIKIEVTFAANGPSAPIVDALAVTWTPVSTLKLAANNPASLCSGATGLWKFPFSVSNVSSKATVVTVPLGTGSLTPTFPDQSTRLQFISATHGGVYHAGPGTIVVDGVTINPNTVYWRLNEVRYGTTFPLGLTAVIPNGTLNGTTYQLTATGRASNAATVSATTTLTTATAQPALVIEKTLTNAYRIGDVWRAKAGSNIGYTITVRNNYASQCRATAERIVVWDPLTIAGAPYNGGPLDLVGLTYSSGGQSLHGSDAAGHLVTVPANAVYAQIPSLAPGASATFSFSMPLKTLPYDTHVINTASVDSGYTPHAGQLDASADFYIGIDYSPHGSYAKGDSIRGSPQVSSFEDNVGLTVGYGEYFKFLLHAHNEGASVLNTTTLFDKLPLGQVALVDVYVPAAANATIKYHTGGDANAPSDPPGYDASTGTLDGGWTTNPAGAKWVAIAIPRIGSSVITTNNSGAPTGVTAEIGVRTLPPTAACDTTPITNVGYFHTAFYEPETGPRVATNVSAQNTEHVTIVPKVPSFETSYAVSNPGIALASGNIRYTIGLTNRLPSAASETDSAQNVVVRVNLPKVEVAGILSNLDLTAVQSAGGTVDYTGLPAYFDISYPLIAANSALSIDVDVFAPKGIANAAVAKLTAQVSYQDIGNVCPVSANSFSASTTFDVTPFVQVDKRLDFAVAGLERPVRYTLRSVNTGEGAAVDTVVFDRLPPELEFVKALIPANGQRIYFSNAVPPQMPASVRANGDFTKDFVLSSGLFQAGVVSGGFVRSPMPNPTWIAVLVDNPALTPPQLPANGVPYEVTLEMLVPDDETLRERVVVNEANIAAAGLLPAVSNRPLLLISDNPALAISGACPGAIAAGENLHLVYTFTNNSTNPDDGVVARIAVPAAGLTPVAVTITTPDGTATTIALPDGDVLRRVSVENDGTQSIVIWDVTGDLQDALASGQVVKMDVEVEAAAGVHTGDQLAVNVSGTATNNVPGSAVVNVGAQCTLIVSNPDIKVTKLVDVASVVQGDTLTYTLVVENNGPHDADNVSISDTLPAGLSFVANSVRVSPSTWAIGAANVSGQTLTWSGANALVGPTGTRGFLPGLSPNIYVSFKVNVGAVTAGSTITNCAATALGASPGGDQLIDQNTGDNTSCVPVRVPNPDPRITKTGPTTVLPDQSFGYTLTWSNASRQAATSVVFFDKIPNIDADGTPDMTVTGVVTPAGVQVFYSATSAPGTDPGTHPGFDPQAPINADWKANVSELSGPTTWIAFVVGALPGNSVPASATVNVVASDPASGPSAAGTAFENCALIELRGGADENTGNNESCWPTQVPGLNVALTKTCDPEGFYPGARPNDETKFVLQVGNLGTTPAYGIKVTDVIPSWFLIGGFTPAVATLEGGASFLDDNGDAIAGGVPWTRTGNTWVLGTNEPTDARYFRKVAMPSGARVNLTLLGAVHYDTAAETLVTNNASVETLRELDTDEEEDGDVLFDNADGCSLTVHRPDPVVQKTADVSFAGAGDAINYTIGYDNLGLAAADQVVIEDLFPEGVDYVIGSLIDVPADATVTYFNGTTWSATAPVGVDGTTAPGVKGIRVTFAAFEAPLAGGFRQNGLVSFDRGTYVGTAWDAAKGAVTVAPGYTGQHPTYTSPRIPTNNSGSILEWLSLLAAGTAAELPVIEVLDGETDAVIMTADELSEDLRGIDPNLHPSLKLRAKFSPGIAADYSGGLVTVGKPSVAGPGNAMKTSGNMIGGISGSYPNQIPVLWEKVGDDDYELVPIDAEGAFVHTIIYLDDQLMVAGPPSGYTGAVVAYSRQSNDTWTRTNLAANASNVKVSELTGDNAALCGPGACAFVAWQLDGGDEVQLAYTNAGGWTSVATGVEGALTSVNALGYVAFQPDANTVSVLSPTGAGWVEVVVAEGATYQGSVLASDAAELVAQVYSIENELHVFSESADPSMWNDRTAAVTSLVPIASAAGGITFQYDPFAFMRRVDGDLSLVTSGFSDQLPGSPGEAYRYLLSAAPGDVVVGSAYGSATGWNYAPMFWTWDEEADEFVRSPPDLSASGYSHGSVAGVADEDGMVAWGPDAYQSNGWAFMRTGEPPYTWTGYPIEEPASYVSVNDGTSELGWVGSTYTYSGPRNPAVWSIDGIANGGLTATLLDTPALPADATILGGLPGGCMVGRADSGGATVGWIQDGAGTYAPVSFSNWENYSDIQFVAETPEHRIFGNAWDGDNNVSVEFNCTDEGLTLTPVTMINGQAVDGAISQYQDGLLMAYDGTNHEGWWAADPSGTMIFLPESGDDFEVYETSFEAGVFFGDGYDDNAGEYGVFATIAGATMDSDVTVQWLPLPEGAQNPDVVDYAAGMLIGAYYLEGQPYTALWSQATPTAEWVLVGSLVDYYPVALVGDGASAQPIVMPVDAEVGDTYVTSRTLTTPMPLPGLDTQDIRDRGFPSQAVEDAFEAGVIADAGQYLGAGDSVVYAKSSAGVWTPTNFGVGYRFLGQVQPGLFLGIDDTNLYLHRVLANGTLSSTPIDLSGATLPGNFYASDLGPISDAGAFMMWMTAGAEDENFTSIAVVPDGESYSVRNIGLTGTQATFMYSYMDLESFAPGIYLGNGCWTLPEYDGYEFSDNFHNGYDATGATNSMRIWGCTTAVDSEELASWEVAYRGDVTPTIGYRTIIEKQCQNQIANTAEISTSTPEVTASNNTSTATTSVATADIAVSVTTPALVVDAQATDEVELTVTVTNNGPNAGKDVVASLVLPAGLTTSAPLTKSFANLAVGASQSFIVPAAFTLDTADVTYNIAATSSAASIDCNTDNDRLTLSLLTGEHPDIRVTKSGPASVRLFEPFTYNVQWDNVGNVEALDFLVTDVLPVGVTILDAGSDGIDAGANVLWPEQNLAIEGSYGDTITAVVESCSQVGRTIVNTISAPYTNDANPTDNEASASTLVIGPAAALDVDLVASRAHAGSSESVHITGYYRNSGTASVQNARLTFDISGWDLIADSVVDGGTAGGAVVYDLGNVPVGAVGSVTFIVTGAAPRAGTFTLTGSGDNICPATATTTSAKTPTRPIDIAKTVNTDNACVGDVVTWTIVVSNPSASAVDAITVSDTVAAGSTYVAGSVTGPGASVAGATISWNVGSIPAYGSATLTYQTTVGIDDDVLVGGAPSWSVGGLDSGVGNTTAVRIDCDNAISLDKASTITCVDGQAIMSVTLTYTNNGLTPLSEVEINDHVGYYAFDSSDPAPDGSFMYFSVPTLAAGASGTFTYSADLSDQPGRLFSNRAIISSAETFDQTSNQAVIAVPECEQAECDDDVDCEDDNVCTDDVCDAGTCVNTAISCNDFSACTNDSCDSQTGCLNQPIVCNDGQACTTDSCDFAVGCVYTTVVCDDGLDCTNDACDPGTGECTTTQVDCDDGNPCTTGDTCDEGTGTCVNTPNACNDNNPCTNDSCDPQTGACVNQAKTCDDNSACTADSCDSGTGQCVFAVLPCEASDECHSAVCSPVLGCVQSPVSCADNSLCTSEVCDPASGCIISQVSCDDFNDCTNDSCNPGTGCAHTAVVCNDFNVCTNDSCDPDVGCVYEAIGCNDNDACTQELGCNATTGCQRAPTDCDDDNACTADSCDPATGCVHTAITCDDHSACTDDSCDPAIGCSYETVECNDDNACTIDFCDAALGCQTSPIDCSDANACTTDQCDPLIGCQHPDTMCDDNNPCTADSCDIDTGCSNDEIDCDDGNPCTTDSCDPVTGCKNVALTCDDNDICTTDSCDPTLGCQNIAVPQEPINCGAGACSGVVEGVRSCIDNAWVDNCDELPTGEIPDSGNCGELRVAYAIVNDASGQPYGTIRCYQDVDNHVIGCETLADGTTLRIYEAFFCGEE